MRRYSSPVLLSELPDALLYSVASVLGLLFGSFLNVVIHRLPREQNIAFPPSTCPACGARIAPYDNIPVFSWLLLRGKARCCKAPISLRYPAVETLGGLAAVAIMQQLVMPLPPSTGVLAALGTFAIYLALALTLLAAMFIDLEHMILPDQLTLGGAALGVLTLPFRPVGVWDALLGGALGYFLVWGLFHHAYRWLRGRPGMGLGDAKLLLLAGVWFGWQGMLFALIAGSMQGTVVALAVLLVQGKISEPQAVIEEREQWQKELAELEPKERAQLEAEFGDDILAHEPGTGLAGAHLAFGPFLVVSILEFMLLEEWITEQLSAYFFVV